jgi:biopolymer transport protein TolQ
MPLPFFLSPVLAITNPITVFERCEGVGQIITAGLGVCSIIAWAVMLGKRNDLMALRRLNHAFDQRLREERRVLDLPESFRNQRAIPYADLFSEAIEAYWRAAAIGKEKGVDTSRFRLEHAENALQRALARQTLRYESSMIFLASIVSGAPFLGLLGTVWGVMTAFNDVSTQQTASILTLAPGLSGALLTTISGLAVAIPSVFGYNWLFGKTKIMITELENFASALADRIELES